MRSKPYVYSKETFMGLFQADEIAAIIAACATDAQVAQVWVLFTAKERIRSSSPALAQAMDLLTAKNLVAAGRKDAVCSAAS